MQRTSEISLKLEITESMRLAAEKEIEMFWENEEVRAFVEKHEDVIDSEMKAIAKREIREFILHKDMYKGRKPILTIYAGIIWIEWIPGDVTHLQMIKDRIIKTFTYDSTTRAFSGIKPDAYDKTNMGAVKAQAEVNNFIKEYVYKAGNKGSWIYGQMGVGKSYLLGYLTTYLKSKNIGFYFVDTNQLYDDMLEISRNYPKNLAKNLNKYKKVEVLILDDIGRERTTKWNYETIISPILDYRMNHKLPTFFSSNYTIFDYIEYLKKSGIEPMTAKRIEERIRTLAKEVQITGQNRRNKA